MQMGLVVICSTSIIHNFGLKVQLQQVKHFYVACNELIHMALLNHKCFSPQSLSCSYRRLTSMQMGLVVICPTSISHNFGLKVQLQQVKHFYVACNELIHMALLTKIFFTSKFVVFVS